MTIPTRKRSLAYHAELPVQDEPHYAEGYTCDSCKREFLEGPMYHCRRTGEDRCCYCSAATEIHPLPPVVAELFVPTAATDKQRMTEEDEAAFIGKQQRSSASALAPVAAYRVHQGTVGIVLTQSHVMVIEVSEVALVRGCLTDLVQRKTIMYEGSELVAEFPFVERWGDPQQLDDERFFTKIRYGSLPARPAMFDDHSSAVPSAAAASGAASSQRALEACTLIGAACGNGMQVFVFRGSCQILNAATGIGTIWADCFSKRPTLLVHFDASKVQHHHHQGHPPTIADEQRLRIHDLLPSLALVQGATGCLLRLRLQP